MTSNTGLLKGLFSVLVICCLTQCCYCHSSAKTTPNTHEPIKDSTISPPQRFFLRNIFSKYGTNGHMTFEGFEHLLESLGLINILDHGLKDHREGEIFINNHRDHEHSKGADTKSTDKVFQIPLSASANFSQYDDRDPPHYHHHPDKDNHHNQNENDHHHAHDHKKLKPHGNFNFTSLLDNFNELNNYEFGGKKCLSPKEMFTIFNMDTGKSINQMSFLIICPAIIYELDQCHHVEEISMHKEVHLSQWLYATLAIVLISVCGLFSVVIIPIMQKWFYHLLLQFLVGLAIGSLSGDALLHLLPHAVISKTAEHNHNASANSDHDAMPIWIGLSALGGIYTFFITERILSIISSHRKQKKRVKNQLKLTADAQQNTDDVSSNDSNGNVGEKLSQYRKNSYNSQISPDAKETLQMLPQQDTQGELNSRRGSSVHEVTFHGRSSFSADPFPGRVYQQAEADPEKFSITVSDHHGHSHGHGHEVPSSMTAVALMVIMGDGLHNFCDGIAIGAAFAAGLSDGVSTTVAVFCHELPHELGDFAMLLRTGMKVKQALMYNILSSVLCLIGMVIGVSLGSLGYATVWIFGGTAGMFLYIALVDMLPELTTSSDDPSSTVTLTLGIQLLGITIGVSIMLLIALFEDTLKTIIS